MKWDEVGWVISSEYRMQVMNLLAEGPNVPSKMAEETGINLSHISRTLTDLKEKDLVELMVEEDRKKGRLYKLTDKGESTWESAEPHAS